MFTWRPAVLSLQTFHLTKARLFYLPHTQKAGSVLYTVCHKLILIPSNNSALMVVKKKIMFYKFLYVLRPHDKMTLKVYMKGFELYLSEVGQINFQVTSKSQVLAMKS